MKKFFCFGKKDFCENTALCIECQHFAGAGGEYRDAPMTNADRIRAMSDEELAEFLFNGDVEYCHAGLCKDGETCRICCLRWLQQPAEDIANG